MQCHKKSTTAQTIIFILGLITHQTIAQENIPSSCTSIGYFTINSRSAPMMRCILDDSLPDSCAVIMPDFDTIVETETNGFLNDVNKGNCKQTKDVTATGSGSTQWEKCFQTCMESSESWECHSVLVGYTNKLSNTCRIMGCDGPTSDGDTTADLDIAYGNSVTNHRTFWFEDYDTCIYDMTHTPAPTMQQTLPPTFEPGSETGTLADNFQYGLSDQTLGSSNRINTISEFSLSECTNTCVALSTCKAFTFATETKSCLLYDTFNKDLLSEESGSVTYERISDTTDPGGNGDGDGDGTGGGDGTSSGSDTSSGGLSGGAIAAVVIFVILFIAASAIFLYVYVRMQSAPIDVEY